MGSTVDGHDENFWLFGYGSLIWKPPPHFDKRIPGWVDGYVRRFWQASEDHRGTPEAPGRVVTLIERSHWDTLGDHHHDAPKSVWGVAYHIKPEKVAEVKKNLDIREINGYSIHYAPFQPADGAAEIKTLVYIGTPDNEQFVGVQDPQELAAHIHKSEGPSGLNKEYLLNLDKALCELNAEADSHIHDLADRVRALDGPSHADPRSPAFHRSTSTREAEEFEKTA